MDKNRNNKTRRKMNRIRNKMCEGNAKYHPYISNRWIRYKLDGWKR